MKTRLLLVLGLLGLQGCAHHATGEWVRHIRYEGNGNGSLSNPNNDSVLEAAQTQPHGDRPSWRHPKEEPSRLNRGVLQKDALRLETHFAHNGYFDAEVDGWVVMHRGKKKHKLRPVDIIGYVSAGEPSLVTEIKLEGLADPLLTSRLKSYIDLAPGDVFELESYNYGISAIQAELQERSYAYAKVKGSVLVDPVEHTVQIHVDIDRGPACRFGEVRVVGTRKVPKDRLPVGVEEGAPYHLSTIEKTRSDLFALRTFQLVNVTPDLSNPGSNIVPVLIELRETKTHSIKLGLVTAIDPGRLSAGASAVYEDWNLGNRLWTLQQEAFAGAGDVFPKIAPMLLANGTLTLHRFPIEGMDFINGGRAEQGLEPGYTFFSLTYSPSLAWVKWNRYVISLGYRLKYNDYEFFSDTAYDTLASEQPDGHLQDPYLLSIVDQRFTYDGRNDPWSPTRGYYALLSVAEAGGIFQGDFDYLRMEAEGRAYRSIVRIAGWDPNIVVAGRLGAGLILPFDPELGKSAVPLDERFFLGGADSMRGWGYRRMGPLIPDTNTPEGGLARVLGSVELRRMLLWDISAVGFVDTGRVWDSLETIQLQGLRVTVGGGLRYNSVAGPIRFDVGVRLGDDPFGTNDAKVGVEPRVGFHFGLGEAF